jgi:hypothetical protein
VSTLVLKDLRLLRPYWWLIVPGYLLFSANGMVHPEVYFWMNVALASAYTLILIIVEWSQDADRFVGSLPVSRERVVQTRYAGALGAAVLGTVLYVVYGHVLLGLGGERLHRRWAETPGWESPEGVLAFFLMTVLLSAAYLPFYFRSGLAKGTLLFVASLLPPVAGLTLLARRLAVDGRAGPPSELLQRALAAVSEAAHPASTIAAALLVAVVLGWLSLRLSTRYYDERDL